jgi:hypothetical protein
MAAGHILGAVRVGVTDELGAPWSKRTPAHHHRMGVDPYCLTYFHAGLNQKLVGVVHPEPIPELI